MKYTTRGSFENYSGMYFDSEGNLVICTSNRNVDEYEKVINNLSLSSENRTVKYEQKKYLYNKLSFLNDYFTRNMQLYTINLIGISDRDNCIIIEIKEPSMEKAITKYLSNLSYMKDIVSITTDCNKLEFDSINAISGRPLYTSEGMTGTIGFNAYDTVTEEYGVVTNYHVAPVQTQMYYGNDILIGTSEKGSRGGNLDVAFIPFNNF